MSKRYVIVLPSALAGSFAADAIVGLGYNWQGFLLRPLVMLVVMLILMRILHWLLGVPWSWRKWK